MKKSLTILGTGTLVMSLLFSACSNSLSEESSTDFESEESETSAKLIRNFSQESAADMALYKKWQNVCTQDGGSSDCTLLIEELAIDDGPRLISGELPPLFLDGMLVCLPAGTGFAGVNNYLCKAELGVTNRTSFGVEEFFDLDLSNYKDFYEPIRDPEFWSPLNPGQTKAFSEAPNFEVSNLDKFAFLYIYGKSRYEDSISTNVLRLCRVVKPLNQDFADFKYEGYSSEAIIFENCLRLNYWDYDFRIPITIDPCKGLCWDGPRWAIMSGFHPRGYAYKEWQVLLSDQFVNDWS
jgi:hypothetical protein